MAESGGCAVTIAVLVFAVGVLALVLAAVPVGGGGHHCCIGWREPMPGYAIPSTLDVHWLWRRHTGCESEACAWKRLALETLWTRGRLRPDARIEQHLRGQK